jgi:hypothetical protein
MAEVLIAVAVTFAATAFLAYRRGLTQQTSAFVAMARRIEDCHAAIDGLRSAHDHQVIGIDRRLESVEVAAADAAQEGRIVSVQLSEITETLDMHTDALTRLTRQRAPMLGQG